MKTLTLALSILLGVALMAHAQVRAGKDWPVTIKVTRDVSLEPYRREKEKQHIRGILQFFPDQRYDQRSSRWLADEKAAVVIRRGQTFQMVISAGQMEGGCRIRFQKKNYEVASCWWREGFVDHQSDIFVVVK